MVSVSESNYFSFSNCGKPVAILFSADWCKSCKAFYPVIESLESEYASDIAFGVVDTGDSAVLAEASRVQSLPTLLLKVDGEEVGRLVGAVSKKRVVGLLDSARNTVRSDHE